MAKIITLEDMNKDLFYKIPKAFYHNPKYMFMKNESKMAYSLLRDILSLSIRNGWVNSNNEPFVRISRERLMIRLQVKGTQKMAQIMRELVENELIVEKKLGQGNTNVIYVCIPDELQNVIYDDEELLAAITKSELENIGISQAFENQSSAKSIDSHKTFENQKSRKHIIKGLKSIISKSKTIKNQSVIETNHSETNLSEANIKKQQLQQEVSEVQNVVPMEKIIEEKEVVIDVVNNSSSSENKYQSELVKCYMDNFGNKPNPAQLRHMVGQLEFLDVYDVIYAIESAARKGKGYDYAIGIMRNTFMTIRNQR